MKIKVLFACVLVIIAVLSVCGQLNPRNHNPDEPADYTYNERFSAQNALKTLKSIDAALQSFQTLTEEQKGKLTKEELAQVGNTAWDVQHLGFYNGVRAIEGTVRKQDYEIKRLEYELAKVKYGAGRISHKSLNERKKAYQEAEQEFQRFWDAFEIRD